METGYEGGQWGRRRGGWRRGMRRGVVRARMPMLPPCWWALWCGMNMSDRRGIAQPHLPWCQCDSPVGWKRAAPCGAGVWSEAVSAEAHRRNGGRLKGLRELQ